GMNTRLDELQAAVLRVKLRHLDRENARRRQVARTYDDLLSSTSLRLPRVRGPVEHVYHQYVVRGARREELKSHLETNGVGTAVHYPVPVPLQPAYRGRVPLVRGRLPVTEQVCREILSLPMHPQLTDEQARYVAAQIGHWERTG